MKHLSAQRGITLVPTLALMAWVVVCALAAAWIADTINYQDFQSHARFIGIAVAAGVAIPGYLLNSLRDLRKQLKDDGSALTRRQVANLNHSITRGHHKAVVMIFFYPATALFMASGMFWKIDSDVFDLFIYGSGILAGLCLAFTFVACWHLREVARFEEKLSNAIKSMKSSAQLLADFKQNS